MSLSLFLSKALIASSIWYIPEISGLKSIFFCFRYLNAGLNCPHLEPKTVISSTTIGAKLNSFDAAIVLFKTKVPLGLTSEIEVSNPDNEPVASTTTSKYL